MNELEVLERRIRGTGIGSFVISACCLVMSGMVLVAAAFTAWQSGLGAAGFMALMGLGGLVVTAMLFTNGWVLFPVKKSELYRIFENEPERIAWAYGRVGKHNGVKIHLVCGGEHTLDANKVDSAALLALVRARAPRALMGWGPEQKRHYAQVVRTRGEALR